MAEYRYAQNRDSGCVRRHRNPDTKRRPSDWEAARQPKWDRRKAVKSLRAAKVEVD